MSWQARPVGGPDMNQQYLMGELSVRLEQLQAAPGPDSALDVMRVRHLVETGPLAGLGSAG